MGRKELIRKAARPLPKVKWKENAEDLEKRENLAPPFPRPTLPSLSEVRTATADRPHVPNFRAGGPKYQQP